MIDHDQITLDGRGGPGQTIDLIKIIIDLVLGWEGRGLKVLIFMPSPSYFSPKEPFP